MEGLNTILIANSTLESTITRATASDPIADGVIVYQSMSGDAEATTGEAATFKVANSTLRSAIASGAMFYFTNTTANALLTNTMLDFEADAADLIRAAGNDASGWGANGSNGATVNFTGLSQALVGDVFVDATSTWVVTADAQVSTPHVASDGQVVDETGATVAVVAAGATAVVGTGVRTVTVAGACDDVVQTTSANELSDDLIDRTAFDQRFGLSTAFTLTGTVTTGTASESALVSATDSNTTSSAAGAASAKAAGSVAPAQVTCWSGGFRRARSRHASSSSTGMQVST